jgi:predicted subunit of tRNA(5-methylaminomethyl-2-thiouridylate) methyltransferase
MTQKISDARHIGKGVIHHKSLLRYIGKNLDILKYKASDLQAYIDYEKELRRMLYRTETTVRSKGFVPATASIKIGHKRFRV